VLDLLGHGQGNRLAVRQRQDCADGNHLHRLQRDGGEAVSKREEKRQASYEKAKARTEAAVKAAEKKQTGPQYEKPQEKK
jgi:hypothetical protein